MNCKFWFLSPLAKVLRWGVVNIKVYQKNTSSLKMASQKDMSILDVSFLDVWPFKKGHAFFNEKSTLRWLVMLFK